jgi:uncharacterized membrane protein
MMTMLGSGLLLPIALILIAAYALRWLPKRDSSQESIRDKAGDGIDILQRRYAQGEINRDRFERMREDLSS